MDLRCPNCGDNLGDAQENSKKAWCGNCATEIDNPNGDDE